MFPFYVYRCQNKTEVRISYAQNWKLAQRLREMGLGYTGTTGVIREPRVVKESCTLQCVYECSLNFNEDSRKTLNRQFWQLVEFEKREYFSKYVERVETKRKYTNYKSRRTYTFIYHFDLFGKRLQVCKKFFLNTLNICPTKIYIYFTKFHDETTGKPISLDVLKEIKMLKSKKGKKSNNIAQ